MIKIKNDTVNLNNVSSKIYMAISIVANIYEENSYGDLVITSCRDSVHSKNSLHYVGQAFDIRIWSVPKNEIVFLCKVIKKQLGKDFDVVYEKDHIHTEYDPK